MISTFFFFFFFLMSVFISHPILLCVLLVASSVTLGLVLHQQVSLWMLNALVLIFLGGMMILFLYISTLSNNEKLFLPRKSLQSWFLASAITFTSLLLGVDFRESGAFFGGEVFLELSNLFTPLKIPSLVFMISLLLVTLFCVVKLTEGFKGSLTKGLLV